MSLDSRADLDTLADATFTTNGVGGISGAELNDGYKRLAASALIKDEAGDIGAGLAWSTGVLRVAAAGVTLAMLENRAASTFIGRKAGAGSGAPQEMSATEAKAILAIAAADVSGLSAFATSTDLANATGTLAIARIADGTVTLAKLANLAQATIIGRASGAGTGVPTALSAAQLSTILGLAAIATSGSASDLLSGTVPNARLDGDYTNIDSILVSTEIDSPRFVPTSSLGMVGALAFQVSAIGSFSTLTLNGDGGLLLNSSTAVKINGTDVSAFATSTDLANATGTLAIARIADGTVTLAKLANLAQATVIGRASGTGTGVPTALSAAQLSTILGLAAIATSGSASDLGTGTLPIARIADGAVTLAKLANLTAGTVIGRASGAGSGVPTALTGAEVTALTTLPTRQDLTSGTAATYTTPADCRRIIIRMWGGGGGGGGAGTGTSAGDGGAGGATIFNAKNANGGAGGNKNNGTAPGAAGRGGNAGSGSVTFRNDGFSGTSGSGNAATSVGGTGGGGPFGGNSRATPLGTGSASMANSGGGGCGGSGITAGVGAGGGGGGGEYVEHIIDSPAGTYTYTVGAGGAAGTVGTSGSAGSVGATGRIIVEEFY